MLFLIIGGVGVFTAGAIGFGLWYSNKLKK